MRSKKMSSKKKEFITCILVFIASILVLVGAQISKNYGWTILSNGLIGVFMAMDLGLIFTVIVFCDYTH